MVFGAGEGITGFSLSLTLWVCSLSGMQAFPLCYGWRFLANLTGIDNVRPVLFRPANVRCSIAAIPSRRSCTSGCRAVLLSAAAQRQVDNPDVVAALAAPRRGTKPDGAGFSYVKPPSLGRAAHAA